MSRTPLPAPAPEALRAYLPSLRYAARLAREREQEHRQRMERIGFVLARRHRRELEALRKAVEGE